MSEPTREQITGAIAGAIAGFRLVNIGGRMVVDLRDPDRQVTIDAEQLVAARITAEQIVAHSLRIRPVPGEPQTTGEN